MDEGGLNVGSLTVEEYLSKLHSKVIYADCAGEEAYIPSLHHNRLVNMDEFLLPILTGMFKKGEPVTTDDPITGEMFTEHITALMGHKEIVEKFKFFDKVGEENSQKEFKTFTKFFGRKTPSEGFREAVELRNKLLNQGLPEELLTPSVDILEEISVHNHHLHIIHGDPGYGKTIHLQQISERFVRQQRTSEQATMPVCIKAKHLAASIREHAKEEREINRDPEDITANDMTWKILTYGTTTTLHTIIAKAIQLTNFPKDVNMNDDLTSLFKQNSSRIVFFIDAFDEAREMDMPNLVHFISRITKEASNSVILTNRNSHADQFGRLWKKMPDRESKNHGIRKYHIDFTPLELRHEMPNKLMAAWEIDGMDVEVRMERNYDEYSKVLTHPLFVGFFAMLVRENQIEKATISEQSGNQKQKDVKINGYTFSHLVFLESVIDLGIEKALTDRDYDVSTKRMKEIFKTIAYGINVYDKGITLDELLLYLERAAILEVSEHEVRAIKDGVGPLYSTDGTSLQWTHKGMSEIGCSWYISEQPHLYKISMGTELFLLSQLNNETLSKQTINRGKAVFDWLIKNQGTTLFSSMVAKLSVSIPGDNGWILEENQDHPDFLDMVFSYSLSVDSWILLHGTKNTLRDWFNHPANTRMKSASSILIVSEFMLRSDQNEYETPKEMLDLWRERYQEEIIGRENSLAALFTENLRIVNEMAGYKKRGVEFSISAEDEHHRSTLGHLFLSSLHQGMKQILNDNDDFAHLKLLLGED